jgi:hypothetical protein
MCYISSNDYINTKKYEAQSAGLHKRDNTGMCVQPMQVNTILEDQYVVHLGHTNT